MSNLRVFEFAKQIGVETLNLMDKLREWEIPIKNHMATLDEETIELIKEKFQTEKAAKEPVKKVKKKVTEKTVATTKKTVSKAASKKASTSAAVAATSKKASSAKTVGVKKTVIRRKAEDIQAAAVAAEAAALQESQEAEAAALAAEAGEVEAQSQTTVAATASETPQAQVPAPIARVAKNIVGRMDLTRVRPPMGSSYRPSGGGSMGGGSGSGMNSPSSIAGAGARNIRTGFIAAPMDPIFEAEYQERKKKQEEEELEKERKRKAKAEEEVVQSFAATEYRKREVIFQPKKKKLPTVQSKKTQITMPAAHKRLIKIENKIKASNLAEALGIKVTQLVSRLMKDGIMVTPNTDIDFDTASLIAPEFNFEVQNVYKTAEEIIKEKIQETPADQKFRIPVVTVMGHVDHGKTSLLDAIRKADVVSGEAGGITQHIGAYKVTLEDGKSVTFIDTPGHEAFTAMRARGANVTDIVVLVVAADDGVMPQTIEALNHAKSAGVPIIVAINKMDKPGANPEKVKQQLSERELLPEEWGGTTIFQPVSAMKKEGIKELLEQILLVAEVQELTANPDRPATGVVVESRLEKGRGIVATLLVKGGTLKTGQYIVAGSAFGRVRSMHDDKGRKLEIVNPGEPVEILGLDKAPLAGDVFDIVEDEKMAHAVSGKRMEEDNKLKETPNSKMSLESIFSKMQAGDVKELPIILKADVAGSVEAVRGMLEKTSTAEVKVKILHTAVGGITESDVLLAQTTKGIILGFNVRPDSGAQQLAKQRGVDIKTYSIIYELVDDIKKALSGLLDPIYKENVLGSAEVRQIFSVPKLGTIAGCSVKDGKITRSAQCRLIREGRIIFEGKLSSLKRFKDDAREVATGFECGIGIENYNDLKVGDVIEAFEKQQVARSL